MPAEKDPAPLLRLSHCSKIYRSEFVETHALSEVSLDIHAGDYLAITGRSGSGKTTLLSVLGLMEPFEIGTLRFAGADVETLSRRERARLRCRELGFVFQFFHLIGDLSVADNIALPMAYAGHQPSAIKTRVGELAERLGIAARLRHLPGQLSGGQQQRVAIARALANDPALLLVDEPTGNLDSENGAQVMDLLAELNTEGRSICLVSHDPSSLRHATRHLVMHDGRLCADTTAPTAVAE